MRFMRTPGKSIVSKSSARNVLRSFKSQGSGMNVISKCYVILMDQKSMAATPWSAAGLCGMKPLVSSPINIDTLLTSISKLLISCNPETIISSMSIVRKERIRSLLGISQHLQITKYLAEVKAKANTAHSKAVWDFTLPIYNTLMVKITALAEKHVSMLFILIYEFLDGW